MVKLVDTLVSGTSGRKAVQVRVLFWALKKEDRFSTTLFFFISIIQNALSNLSGASTLLITGDGGTVHTAAQFHYECINPGPVFIDLHFEEAKSVPA